MQDDFCVDTLDKHPFQSCTNFFIHLFRESERYIVNIFFNCKKMALVIRKVMIRVIKNVRAWWNWNNRPGRLLRLFLEPKSLTREKTFSRLGFSQLPLVLLGLLTQRQALDFSRSLACLFCLMRELAIAAAIASLAALWGENFLRNGEDITPFESKRLRGNVQNPMQQQRCVKYGLL